VPDRGNRNSIALTAVKNELVDQVMEAIVGASKTGKVGDGKIFVTDILRVLRIRTGESDNAAL
jgi:nitrogen regulatory protein PII